jgi:PAS domain S-box-containing protein
MGETIINPDIKKAFPWKLVEIFLLFSVAIILVGIFYYESQKNKIFTEQENNLSAIALLKINQILSWRNERIEDATVISHDKPLIRSIEHFLKDGNKEGKSELFDWMKSVRNEYDFTNVLIADTSFKIRLSVDPPDTLFGESIKKEMKTSESYHSIMMTDLHRSKEVPYIHLDLLIPLFDSVKKNRVAVGVAILRIDPAKILFPLIQSWPTPSKSSETLLLRREKDSILYLNELRHSKNTALKLNLPLSNKNLLGTKAANGFEGVAEGIDYRNIPVVGSLHKIPGTSWFMVAKVDKEEILLPLQKYSFMIVLVVVLLVLINASIFGFWIWQQRRKLYINQLRSEVLIRELEERFSTAFRMSPVSVTISSVANNKFIDVNNTFLRDMEYALEEVIGRTAKELNIWADEKEREWIINEIGEKGKVFGKVISYKTRTGKILYGLSSMSVVKVNGEPCNLSTVVNITESKNAELKLIESEELFRKLFENMLNGFAYCKMIYEEGHPPDFLYLNVNESFSALTGLKDVIGKKASEAIPGIQEADPELLERYGRVAMTGQPEVFETWVEALKMWFSISVYSPEREYFVAVFDVITARKVAERDLRASEERYRNIFNSLIEGFCIIEMVFDEENKPIDYRFLEINSSFEKQTGLHNVKGKLMRELAPDHESYWFEIYGKVALTGESVRFENEAKELNRWFEVRASRVDDQESRKVALYFNDITGRKLSEAALRESEQRFRSLYENATIGIYRTTLDGKILMANPALVKMLGFSSFEDLANRNLEEEGYEPDYPRAKFLEILEKEDKIIGLESAWHQRNGNTLYVRESASVIRDAEGTILYYDGNVEDITYRKQAEEALRESEERFSKSFRTSPISFVIANIEDGRIIEINDAFTSISGFTREEALGNTTLNMKIWVHEEDRKHIIDSLSKGKAILHKETMLRSKEGKVAIVLLSAQVIKLANRNCIISSIEDITKRKEAEDELRIQSEIMSHMAEAVYLVRIEDSVIVYANSRFEELFGYGSGEMTGKPVSIVNAPTEKSPEETATEIIGELEKNGFWTGEVLNIKKDGTVFWTHANVAIFDHSKFGKVLVSVQQDITDRKNAESQIKKLNEELEGRVIQRTELLEAANKELEAFSYSVSHDLRAPLRSVHGFTKILLEDYEPILDDEGKRICQIISSSATQMGKLIDDLLSFSRIGRTNMNPSMLDMRSLAKAAYEEISSSDQKLRTKLKLGKLHKVFGDANLLRIIWNNLISNAIKYSSKEKISEIGIKSQIKYDSIVYSIKDNGVGFDMDYKHKLFGVFQRLHSEAEFEGNGVGLAIVQRIILKHGGKVWAEGEVGKGATFYFSLPITGDRQQASGDRQKYVLDARRPTPDA